MYCFLQHVKSTEGTPRAAHVYVEYNTHFIVSLHNVSQSPVLFLQIVNALCMQTGDVYSYIVQPEDTLESIITCTSHLMYIHVSTTNIHVHVYVAVHF